ncbi:MAG: cell division protein FtsA [Chloroflexi bacterium]|nr:cell division protein FtsA [Chloroflexota bacterium]
MGRLNTVGELEVLGLGLVPSRGMKKGMVSNLSEVTQVTQASIREAEAQAGVRISSAYVGLTGSHISSANSRASLDNRRYDVPVAAREVEQVLQACSTYGDSSDARVLHVIPRGYALDGYWGIGDPVGMFSSKLEVESHVVQGGAAPIDNLVKAISKAKVKIKGMVLEPLASAEAILAPEEREMGVVLVDIGGGTSDIAIFLDGNIWHTKVIPVGGFQLTRDVSIAFSCPLQAAEDAKLQYGHAMPEAIDPQEEIRLQGFGEHVMYSVPRQRLCQTLRERMEELLRMILAEIGEAGLESVPPGGLVLTGGSAKLPGLEDLAEEVFPGPVRIGIPRAMRGASADLEDPAFATALGLLLWDIKQQGAYSWHTNGNGFKGNEPVKGLAYARQWLDSVTRRVHQQIRRYSHG